MIVVNASTEGDTQVLSFALPDHDKSLLGEMPPTEASQERAEEIGRYFGQLLHANGYGVHRIFEQVETLLEGADIPADTNVGALVGAAALSGYYRELRIAKRFLEKPAAYARKKP
jgi:hypothetical protein